MSQQQVSAGFDSTKTTVGSLVVGIRVDTVPLNESTRIAADVEYYPLTLDKRGFLQVVLPGDTVIETKELEVLREIRETMIEVRDLLQKIAN